MPKQNNRYLVCQKTSDKLSLCDMLCKDFSPVTTVTVGGTAIWRKVQRKQSTQEDCLADMDRNNSIKFGIEAS